MVATRSGQAIIAVSPDEKRLNIAIQDATYSGQTYTVSYTYDSQGRPIKLTYPSGREAEYTYDDRQMLKTIKWETAQIEDRSYNDAGLLTGVDRTYVDETRTYNAGSQLTQISSTNVGSQTYTYDANGNVISETLSGNMANYSFTTEHSGGPFADGYDAEDRFMRFKRNGLSENILLTRSDIGNISNVNFNGGNTARGYNNAHGLTSVGAAFQTYDTDGNTTTLHTAVTAVWDDAGSLKNTDVSSSATAGIVGFNEYGYVGGLRIWKKITRGGSVVEHRVHIHAGPNLVAEYNAGVAASTPVQEYVYAGEIDSLVMIRRSDGTKYGVSRNRQWSVVALHDLANGNVVERYAYEMTGKRTIYAADGTTVRTTSSYGNNFGYTNRWHDEESGLMYFRARYYNPLSGEFLSRDPMEFVDGMSLYRGYFSHEGVDPLGLTWLPPRCYLNCVMGSRKLGPGNVKGDCCRDTVRFELDLEKKLGALAWAAKSFFGFQKLKLRFEMQASKCCERCGCDDELEPTLSTFQLGFSLEGEWTSGHKEIWGYEFQYGGYIRAGAAGSLFARFSKCDGVDGGGCGTISVEGGGIIAAHGRHHFEAGGRAGINVTCSVCLVCSNAGCTVKRECCISGRARLYFKLKTRIRTWEWYRQWETPSLCFDLPGGGGGPGGLI